MVRLLSFASLVAFAWTLSVYADERPSGVPSEARWVKVDRVTDGDTIVLMDRYTGILITDIKLGIGTTLQCQKLSRDKMLSHRSNRSPKGGGTATIWGYRRGSKPTNPAILGY